MEGLSIASWVRRPPKVPPRRFVLLDGLRGVAAFSILFWHYQHFFVPPGQVAVATDRVAVEPLSAVFWPFFEYGSYSVVLFWMISGFVFASVYGAPGATTREFVANRIARLYPLHLVTLLTVAGFQLLAQARFGHSLIYGNNDAYHFALQLAFASNWGFERGESFNGPIWSVSVEVLIYGIFWLLHRRLFAAGLIVPGVVMGVSVVAYAAHVLPTIAQCTFFFFGGSLVFFVYRKLSSSPACAILLSTGVFALAVALIRKPPIAGASALGTAGVFASVVLTLAVLEPRVRGWPQRYLAAAGDMSYGMYLWHVPLQMLVFLMMPVAQDVASWARSSVFLIAYLATVIIVARASFLYIERPWRSRIRQLANSRAVAPAIAAP